MKLLVIANWKMNPSSQKEAKILGASITKSSSRLKKTRVVICPPFTFFHTIKNTKKVSLGAQNVFLGEEGAYTGEIGTSILLQSKVSHVILGHSEQRALGEEGKNISAKAKLLIKKGITPVICIGEKERDSQGEFLRTLEHQLLESLHGLSSSEIKKITLAYEPVWAIGAHAKKAQSPEDTLETILFIRKILSQIIGKDQAFKHTILYGGSVNSENAEEYIKEGGVQGLLVGRTSLDGKAFAKLLHSVDSIK